MIGAWRNLPEGFSLDAWNRCQVAKHKDRSVAGVFRIMAIQERDHGREIAAALGLAKRSRPP